jgi:competence protein ComEC
MGERLASRPAAAIAIFFSLGIGLAQICSAYIFCSFALAGFSLIAASLLALQRDRRVLSFALGSAAITIAGLLMFFAHRDGIPSQHIRALLSHSRFPLNEPVLFEGCAAEDSERRAQEDVTTIAFHGFLGKGRWVACEGKGMLRIAVPDSKAIPFPNSALAQGDRVRGWAVWQIPRNYQNPGSADRVGQLARREIFLIGKAKSPRLLETIPGDCANLVTAASGSVRNRVRKGLESINRQGNGQSAAILASLTIGDYSGLDNSTRKIFQNTGAFHVLVVSGLHVAWIAGVLMLLFRLLRLPERMRYLLASAVIIFYAFIIGFQASITRCLWMFLLFLLGRMLIRRADSLNILFASAFLILLVEPNWLLEVGFQLSFLSVMAIALTAAPAIETYLRPVLEPLCHAGNSSRLFLRPGSWHRCGRKLRVQCELLVEGVTDSLAPAAAGTLMFLLRVFAGAALAIGGMLLVSISVQIWLEPLLAYYFNRLSWISPLANLVIVPFSSLVLSAGVVSSLAMTFPAIGTSLVQLAGWLAAQLLYCTCRISMLSGAWQRCPTPSIIWVGAGLMLLFAWSFFQLRRFWIPCACICALLAALSCGWRPAPYRNKESGWKGDSLLKLTFLDVGEGDSAIISFPNGQHWAIDAGGLRQSPSWEESSRTFDIGEAVVSRYLWHEWITKLDCLILSHPDLDHAGGVPTLIENFRVDRLNFSPANDAILDAVLRVAREKKVRLNMVRSGMEERLGEVTIRIFSPAENSTLVSANDNSIVLGIYYGRFSAIFTGDLEKVGESEILNHSWDLRTFLLKIAHHGSRSGTSDSFLDRTKPLWAVISAGRNNPFGHPSKQVLERLLKHGARPVMTLDQGAVTFETDGVRYSVKSHVAGIVSQQTLGPATK